MQDDLKIYLKRKAATLDLDRGAALKKIQGLLDKDFPAKTKAKSLNEGVLKIITPSASVASELRLRQEQYIPVFTQATTRSIERLHIQITTL